MSTVKTHDTPDSPVVTSISEQLRVADILRAEAELYQSQYWKEKLTKRQRRNLILLAYLTFSEAIALYEAVGDFASITFKQKLARLYQDCAYVAGRCSYLDRKGEQILLGADALHTSLFKKAVELYAQTLGDMQSDESQANVWDQILRLHNVSSALTSAGFLAEAERYVIASIDLQKQFVAANDEIRLDHRIWLPAHFHLAQITIGLKATTEHTLAIIDAGLEAFKPASLRSAYGLKFYGKLCALKSELIEKSEQSSPESAS